LSALQAVEQLGSELEKKDNGTIIDSKASNYYYRIVEAARQMDSNTKNQNGHDVAAPYRS